METTVVSETPVRPLEAAFDSSTKGQWRNKKRTLIVSTRGPTERHRHLMLDLFHLLPHSKKEVTTYFLIQFKIEKKDTMAQIEELCELHTCYSYIFFESRRRQDLYLWIGIAGTGPSAKFLVENS